MTNLIEDLKSLNRSGYAEYTLHEDNLISVKGNVNICSLGLTEIPFKFKRVTGFFACGDNKLSSLKNCPEIVGQSFTCFSNDLSSLEYGPIHVGENYFCFNNNLSSLKFLPKKIYGNLDLRYNSLTDLKYISAEIDGNLDIDNNYKLIHIGHLLLTKIKGRIIFNNKLLLKDLEDISKIDIDII